MINAGDYLKCDTRERDYGWAVGIVAEKCHCERGQTHRFRRKRKREGALALCGKDTALAGCNGQGQRRTLDLKRANAGPECSPTK